jgi:hypothetical protein
MRLWFPALSQSFFSAKFKNVYTSIGSDKENDVALCGFGFETLANVQNGSYKIEYWNAAIFRRIDQPK